MPIEGAGRVALVTGAAGRGIGRAIATRLAADRARVVITDVHERRTAEVADELAGKFPDTTVVGHPMDAGDRAHVDHVLGEVTASLGPVQVLVNNAAMNVLGSIFDYDPADWDRVLRLNLSGPWYLSRVVMPIMREAGGGAVVNIGSYAGDNGGMGLETPYAVTKGALGALTRACAHEGGPFGIRVNQITMGVVTGTKFVDDHPELAARPDVLGSLGTLPTADEIAAVTAFLVSDAARSITGETINVAAGAYMRT